MSFPTKEERSVCYEARDRYWQCLDVHQLAKAESNPGGPCEELRKLYVKGCPSQWVKHFDRKHSYLKFKAKIENEGYEPLTDDNRKTAPA